MSVIPQARQDGRPLYYDVAHHQRCQCVFCLSGGIQTAYPYRHVVVNDPANPPKGEPQGSVHTICVQHIPEDAVIYCPWTKECRDKHDTKKWIED